MLGDFLNWISYMCWEIDVMIHRGGRTRWVQFYHLHEYHFDAELGKRVCHCGRTRKAKEK